jgi:hypothetical protein
MFNLPSPAAKGYNFINRNKSYCDVCMFAIVSNWYGYIVIVRIIRPKRKKIEFNSAILKWIFARPFNQEFKNFDIRNSITTAWKIILNLKELQSLSCDLLLNKEDLFSDSCILLYYARNKCLIRKNVSYYIRAKTTTREYKNRTHSPTGK